MPNHCTHRLVVDGPPADIADLVMLMQGESCFDFNKLIPCPEELKNTKSPADPGPETDRLKAKHGHADWYSWNIANWGTKWNAYSIEDKPLRRGQGSPLEELAEAHSESTTREIEYSFDTAWSPPMPILNALVQRFPTCTFTWYGIEESLLWGALITWVGGEQAEGGFEEGDEDRIWGMSPWHERMRGDDEVYEDYEE